MDPSQAQLIDPNAPPKFEIPPLRFFALTRMKAVLPWSEDEPVTETIDVSAHFFNYDADNVVAFYDYVLDPVLGPAKYLRRYFRGVIDVQEQYLPEMSETAKRLIN